VVSLTFAVKCFSLSGIKVRNARGLDQDIAKVEMFGRALLGVRSCVSYCRREKK
jgi:hypothetical protein